MICKYVFFFHAQIRDFYLIANVLNVFDPHIISSGSDRSINIHIVS